MTRVLLVSVAQEMVKYGYLTNMQWVLGTGKPAHNATDQVIISALNVMAPEMCK